MAAMVASILRLSRRTRGNECGIVTGFFLLSVLKKFPTLDYGTTVVYRKLRYGSVTNSVTKFNLGVFKRLHPGSRDTMKTRNKHIY